MPSICELPAPSSIHYVDHHCLPSPDSPVVSHRVDIKLGPRSRRSHLIRAPHTQESVVHTPRSNNTQTRQLGRLTGRQAPPADRIVAVAVALLLAATVAMISWCLSSLLVLARLEVMPWPA